MTHPDMMRGRGPPHFHTETATGTASGSAEKEAESETRRENGDAPALGTGGDAPGVETRMSGAVPESGARTRTETESEEAAVAGNEHAGSGSGKRSSEVVAEVVVEAAAVVVAVATWLNPLKLVMQLLMMGLLESSGQMGLMAQKRRAGIETGSDVGVTGARGNDVGTETVIGIESTNGEIEAARGAGMRPGVGVGAVRTMGWKGWVVMVETCTWRQRVAMGTWLQRMAI